MMTRRNNFNLKLQVPVLFRGEEVDDTKVERVNQALGIFEELLKGRTWAAVNNFTLADLALTISIAQLEMFGFDLEPYTRIRTWLQRCKDHLRPHGYDVNIFGSDLI